MTKNNKVPKFKQASSYIGVNGRQTDEDRKDIKMNDDALNNVEYAERLKLLGLSFINDRFYKMFDGKNMEVKEFLEQFNEVRMNVDHETLMRKIKASSKGNAYKWICGLDEEVTNSWERFKEEMIEFFGSSVKNITIKCMRKLKKGFTLGKLEEELFEIFENKRELNLTLEQILELGCEGMHSSYRRKLLEAKKWVEAINIARNLDPDAGRDKEIRNKNQKKTINKGSSDQAYAHRQVAQHSKRNTKRGLECFVCKGPHYASQCQNRKIITSQEKKDDKNYPKQVKNIIPDNLIAERVVDSRPFVYLRLKDKNFRALVDSGASHNFVSPSVAVSMG
ncbi:hypothetical protein M153_1167000165 [Pseudoloma neurophilia]|uniref:Uncharacterized protein n=1 Tax=Pseudoloma neurophilia TaxID=146866 RepID=A0A0R0M384_9MICR|nr:hypothetical protein M153_1167000165 [Pseudoloma neurophilia]